MKHVSCLICGVDDAEPLVSFPDDPYLKRLSGRTDFTVTYVICRNCGFVHTDPMLDDAELEEMYGEKYRKGTPSEKFIQGNLKLMRERYAWISRVLGGIEKPGRVLDIGCGAGILLRVFQDHGWETRGIEPSEIFSRFGNERFGVSIAPGFFTEESFPGETFDLIILSHVLEHIPDPRVLLRNVRKKLAPGGHFFVGVPTLFRPHRPIHPETLAATHLHIFSKNTLGRLLSDEGFGVTACESHVMGLRALVTDLKGGGAEAESSELRDDYRLVKQRFEEILNPDTLYNRNLEALRSVNAGLARELECLDDGNQIMGVPMTDGIWNLSIRQDGREFLLYDRNPVESAREAVRHLDIGEEGLIVLVGFGGGYLAQEVWNCLKEGHVLIIYEPRPEVLKGAFSRVDHTALLSDPRVRWVTGEDTTRLKRQIAIDSKKYILTGKLHVVKHSASWKVSPEVCNRVKEELEETLKVIQINRNTRMGLGLKMLENTLENIHLSMRMPGVDRLKGLFQGVPVIIVSAGPSLEKNFHHLREAQGKAVIIAADTVLRLLVPNGIMPDLIITADPQQSTYRKFNNLPMGEDSFLVCHPANYPDIIRTFGGRHFTTGPKSSIYLWMSRFWPEKGNIDVRSQCVAHLAFNLAALIGGGPVIFVGQDLCYYRNKKHAANLTKGAPWEGKKQTKEMVSDTDILGEAVETTILFQSFKILLEELVKHSGIPCINATEGGLGIRGGRVMTLRDAIREFCIGEKRLIGEKIREAYGDEENLDIQGFLKELEKVHLESRRLSRIARKLVQMSEQAGKMFQKEKIGTRKYYRLSELAEQEVETFKSGGWLLEILAEYVYGLDLYLSSRSALDVDREEDLDDRFRLQMKRAGIYYKGILKALLPLEKGSKRLMERLQRIQTLKEIESRSVQTIETRLKQAIGYKELFYYRKAAPLFLEVLTEDPDRIEALYHLGDLYLRTHHPAKALPLLKKVAARNGLYQGIRKLIEDCHEKLRTWEEKLREAQVEAPVRTGWDELLYEGEFYFRIGEAEKAEGKFLQAIEEKPDFLEAYLDLARIYEVQGDGERVIGVFEKALAHLPENADLHREIGLFSTRVGLYEQAEKFLQSAVLLSVP